MTSLIDNLFKLYEDYEIDKDKIKFATFIREIIKNKDELLKFSFSKTPIINVDKIEIDGVEKEEDDKFDLVKLLDFDFISSPQTSNKKIEFARELQTNINKYLKEDDKKNYLNYSSSIPDFMREFAKTNEKINKKIKEIAQKKKELTKKEIDDIFNSNKNDFQEEIDEFTKDVNNLIKNYKTKLDTSSFNQEDTDILNLYFNNGIKQIRRTLNDLLKKEEKIQKLFELFKKEFVFPDLKPTIEDLEDKYKDFKKEVFDKKDFKDLKILLKYQELFDTKNGDWINDSKKDQIIKEYKDKYDKYLAQLKAEKVEVSEEFTDLYNYSEKIKEIKAKLDKKGKLQETELDFIKNFDGYMKHISSNPQYASNPDFKNQIDMIKTAFKTLNIKERVIKEEQDKRIIKDVITEKEREENKEDIYFDKYASFFRMALKIFVYGGILFAFIVFFISILGILILIYDIIINSITLLVNSANSTRNLSLDYISKSIIRCNKNDYNKDRFLILTEQKQNLSIFNLGAYTLYLLIIYFITYLMLTFYTSQMKIKFIGSLYDIDDKFIYLMMIVILIIYSFIHLLIFKFLFKPFVYIPYKTIDEEEKEIDKLIASYIILKTDKGDIIRFDDFFELLYDASKIDKLNDYFLKKIKNKDRDGCLEQQIIIYNLYEYLRQYVYFDDDFKYNFKRYCSTDENNKPEYENKEKITFLSMLKNDEVKIISNYHEDLNFISNLADEDIEFYNKLNTEVSKKITNINKKIITHNKTTLPFFITIIYMIIILLVNSIALYFIIQMILGDKTDAYHPYIQTASIYVDDYIYKPILNMFIVNNKE